MHHAASISAVLLVAAAMAGTSPAAAQEPFGELVGQVLLSADGTELADVRVTIVGTDLSSVSDTAGRFRIDAVPAGDHVLTVSYQNLASDVAGSVPVAVSENETVWITILLEINVVPVPELVVQIEREDNVGKMAGFDRRRTLGSGTFILREDIDRAQPSRLSQLFYAVPGVRVVPPPSNDIFGSRLISARGGLDCYMQYYLDGIRQPQGSFDIDLLPPEDVQAIEVYSGPSRTPAIYAHRGAPCGVVAIWTRDPTRQER